MSDENNTGYNSALGWLILSAVFAAIFTLFWYYQSQNIYNILRWIRIGEINFVSLFVGNDYMVYKNGAPVGTLGEIKQQIGALDKSLLTGNIMSALNAGAFSLMKYLYTLILIGMGIWSIKSGPKSNYRSKLDLNNLIQRQSVNFPAIAPFIHFNPCNQPPRPPGAPVPAELPDFAEALSPEEWVAYFDIPVPNGKVDKDAAARAFAKQLGAPWRGTMHLAPYKQVLLAAFCLKANRKRADADEMLGQLAGSWSLQKGMNIDGKLLRKARGILRNRDLSGKILSKCNQHAFETTVLMRALAVAREEGGVLAPAQFVWLRGYDRTLWYPLNNLGRQSHHTEALGAIGHYKAEKLAQRPIPRPKTEDAVQSVTEYIASPNARPIPALDYSKSKKRAIKQVKK